MTLASGSARIIISSCSHHPLSVFDRDFGKRYPKAAAQERSNLFTPDGAMAGWGWAAG
jgi:hypothetical protein